MATYPAGDVARLSVTFTLSGVNTDPTSVTLSVKVPSGTTTSYIYGSSAIVKDATGQYHYDLTLATSGLYEYRWVGTGTVTAANESSLFAGPSNFV